MPTLPALAELGVAGEAIAVRHRAHPARCAAVERVVCEQSQGPVALQAQRQVDGAWRAVESPPPLADDGGGADECAGDGEHAGTWSPPAAGSYRLRFWSPASGEDAEDLYVDVR